MRKFHQCEPWSINVKWLKKYEATVNYLFKNDNYVKYIANIKLYIKVFKIKLAS